MIESYESIPKGNVHGAVACSFAKARVRQDAERSLRDAGAPLGEISVPERHHLLINCLIFRENPRPAGCRTQPAGRRRSQGRNIPGFEHLLFEAGAV
jgi:hypothetical protein